MLDAVSLLDSHVDTVRASADLPDDAVAVESIDGRLYGEILIAGVSFVVGDDGLIGTVHVHPEGHEGYRGYVGPIPSGIRFDMTRAEVRSHLGSPSAAGEPRTIDYYEDGPAWDRFDLGHAQMHVEYAVDGRSIQLVTLMTQAAVPGAT